MKEGGNILVLSGGVGGAKLVLGLSRAWPARKLTVCANTGDDFRHLGLHVSPDVDSLIYALAGVNNPDTGWGRRDETWSFMQELSRLGCEDWFRLGDRDLAVHVYRTHRLESGRTLSEVTSELCARFGVETPVVPMTDGSLRTIVETEAGRLAFQDYFVRRRCEPSVHRISFDGDGEVRPAPRLEGALNDPDLAGIVICPSNPWLSIDPILAVPGIRDSIVAAAAPVIAVSPIIGGRSVKGPTSKIMQELNLPVSALSVAEHYRGLVDAFVLDRRDASLAGAIGKLGMRAEPADTLMRTQGDRLALAGRVLELISSMHHIRKSGARV